MKDRVDLMPDSIVTVSKYFRVGRRLVKRRQKLVVIGVSYKNPRGRIHMKTLSGKHEYLIYPKQIVKVFRKRDPNGKGQSC